MRIVGWGLGLTAPVTGILWLAFGNTAIVPAVSFGLVATAIQLASLRLIRPVLNEGFTRFGQRWAMGMGLRLVGVVLVFVAIAIDRELFPPLATAFGFLGVMVPLLFVEVRYVR